MINIHKLREFIKNNFKLIFSSTDSTSSIKELKRRKFVFEWNKQFGVPSEREIAEQATILLIEMKQIKTETELDEQIRNIPFLKNNITDLNKFKAYMNVEDISMMVKKEDIVKHDDKEFVRQKIGLFVEDEKKKLQEEINSD